MEDEGYWTRELPGTDADDKITLEGDDVDVDEVCITQTGDFIFVDRAQAEKLIELLQSWLRGEIARCRTCTL